MLSLIELNVLSVIMPADSIPTSTDYFYVALHFGLDGTRLFLDHGYNVDVTPGGLDPCIGSSSITERRCVKERSMKSCKTLSRKRTQRPLPAGRVQSRRKLSAAA